MEKDIGIQVGMGANYLLDGKPVPCTVIALSHSVTMRTEKTTITTRDYIMVWESAEGCACYQCNPRGREVVWILAGERWVSKGRRAHGLRLGSRRRTP